MDKKIQDMIKLATKARDAAYAPYSKHPVGVAVMAMDGHIYAGSNVENAAYPQSRCAESTAIGNMILGQDGQGGSSRNITTVVIVGPGKEACTPCGGCRQSLREFAVPDAHIYICDNDGKIIMDCDFASLLPHSFGPENVKEVNSEL